MKATKLSIDDLCKFIDESKEISRENISEILTVRCNHPIHGEVIWIQGGGDAIMVQV